MEELREFDDTTLDQVELVIAWVLGIVGSRYVRKDFRLLRFDLVKLCNLAGLKFLDIPVHPFVHYHLKLLIELDLKLPKHCVNLKYLLKNKLDEVFFLLLVYGEQGVVEVDLGVLQEVFD